MTTVESIPMDPSRLVDFLTDDETSLLARGYFMLRLEEEFKKSWRYGWSYALLVVDESTGVSTRRPRAPATLADGVEGWRRAGRQICIHERGGREWVFSKIGCPYPFRKSSTATEASEGGV